MKKLLSHVIFILPACSLVCTSDASVKIEKEAIVPPEEARKIVIGVRWTHVARKSFFNALAHELDTTDEAEKDALLNECATRICGYRLVELGYIIDTARSVAKAHGRKVSKADIDAAFVLNDIHRYLNNEKRPNKLRESCPSDLAELDQSMRGSYH